MSQYIIAFNDEWVAPHTDEELIAKDEAVSAVVQQMHDAGIWVFGNGGIDASTLVCSVVAEDGEAVFSDGPFVETKEHLGGFCVIDVPDDEAARDWAGRVAVALDWPQEVHRFPASPSEQARQRLESDQANQTPKPPQTTQTQAK